MKGASYLVGTMFGMWFAYAMLYGNMIASVCIGLLLVGGWLVTKDEDEPRGT